MNINKFLDVLKNKQIIRHNRDLARKEHKQRVKYTRADVFTDLFYDDLEKRKTVLKLPVIAKLYNFNLDKFEDFQNACLIAELDIQDIYLKV